MKRLLRSFALTAALAVSPAVLADDWTPREMEILRSLWIGSLPDAPQDPSNRYADDPRAAALGQKLFNDRRLSSNGKVACATCHVESKAFTDGRALARGVGVSDRNAPSVIGAAWSPWQFWDGRRDSLWSQALASIENPLEHNATRELVVSVMRRDADYRRRYREIFGPLPSGGDKEGITRAFVNVGKAIEAYERTLRPAASRFDRYVAARLAGRMPRTPDESISLDEELGLRAFLSVERSQCLRCHNGPLFTNGTFHNIASQNRKAITSEAGRSEGVGKVLSAEFNCLSRWSDARPGQCPELEFARAEGHDLVGAFKAPSLRNVARTGPYFHDGHINNLEDVIWHYRTRSGAVLGQSELEAATMTGTEFDQLRLFLHTLDSPPVKTPPGKMRAAAATEPTLR